MFNCKLDFRCVICNQNKNWYITPLSEKTKSGDFRNSLTKYQITCKECGMLYLLEFKISQLEHRKRKQTDG